MIFDGKKLSREILESLKKETVSWKKKPRLAVVSLGDKTHNSSYISQKKKAADFLDFGFKHYHFDSDISSGEFRLRLNKIAKLEANSAVVVQLPLPANINAAALNVIPLEKDPDLLSEKAVGVFFGGRPAIVPPVPAAILKIMDSAGVPLAQKRVVIFGLGRLVGRFLVSLLAPRAGCVSVVEKNTPQDLALELSLKADIIISAVGEPGIIRSDMVKEGAVVVDAGFSLLDGRVVGDVDFGAVRNKVSLITPVPGGVGPVAVAMLFSNIVTLYKNKNE